MDPRIREHAKVLVGYSTRVKRGDNVLIMVTDRGMDLATEVYKEASLLGASPMIIATPTEATRGFYELVPEDCLKTFPKHNHELVKASDVIISIRSDENTRFLSNIDPQRISRRFIAMKELFEERLRKRWCLTQHPTPAYAQDAEMALREYEDFVYSAILIDWREEAERMRRLKEILDGADRVRLVGPETDLRMSIKGRTPIVDAGAHNMPGGEVFTAPIEGSVEGEAYFDLPAIAYGREVTDIRLRFEGGEIVDFSAGKNEALLRSMVGTDMGSKKLGELGVGMNRRIDRFTKNILFDEKIGNTVHLAIGRAYKECGGTNESAIHWDMIKTMEPGEIIVDGEVVYKDGRLRWE